MEAGLFPLQRKSLAGSGGKTEECGNAEEKCAGPQTVFAEKVFESGNCAESRRRDPVLFFVFFDYLRVAWGDSIFHNDFPDRVGSNPAGRGIFH